jgi:outer membrane protein assembly factor BamB
MRGFKISIEMRTIAFVLAVSAIGVAVGCSSHESSRRAVVQVRQTLFANDCSNASGLAEAPWPMRGFCPSHKGRSSNLGTRTSKLNWTFNGTLDIQSSPVIGDAGRTIYFGSDDNRLHAVSVEGTERWSFQTGADVESVPAVAFDGTIYVGSDDNKLYAINPDGTLKWAFSTGNDVKSSPVVAADHTIYVGSDDNKLYSINPNGTLKWSFSTAGDVSSSPALGADQTIYVGSDDNKLYALNPNGTVKWSFSTGGDVNSSPAIAPDGTIYVGSDDNRLYALTPAGTLKWSFLTSTFLGDVRSSPALGSDGTIYFGAQDGLVRALNPNGTLRWSFDTDANVESSPAVSGDNLIYVGSHNHKVYALNSDGSLLWSFDAGDEVRASPAISETGLVYIGGEDLFSLGDPAFPIPGQGSPPTIAIPGAGRPAPFTSNPACLPTGGHAHFPAVQGDPFSVTLPVQQQAIVLAADVKANIVGSVLCGIGFTRGVVALGDAPQNGITMPAATFAGQAAAVADEYRRNPALYRVETQEMLDVFTGATPPNAEIDAALDEGEGMNFAQYLAGIERREIQYVFQQLDQNVPIEHSGIVASRWEQQGITFIQGALFDTYAIANQVTIPPSSAFGAANAALSQVSGVTTFSETLVQGPYLVLLPYTTNANHIPQLRYAYRMLIFAKWNTQIGPFLLWLDAQNGTLLKLESLIKDGAAQGTVYNRDPGVGTTTQTFRVNDALASTYTLQLTGTLSRVDFKGDGYDASDVSIPDNSGGSSATLANFDQAPINDAAQALCGSGTNKAFQQVNLFSAIFRDFENARSLGIFTPFPTTVWTPKVESASAGCNGWASLDFGVCKGYTDADCPNFTTGDTSSDNFMNIGHDGTFVSHEAAHNITPRLTQNRPADWCSPGGGPCAVPTGWGTFHDLCDAWADHFHSTNCWSGWVGKNLNGVNQSLNCTPNHDEGGYAPRRHVVTTPFNPAAAEDHFPEHRVGGNNCDYCDGQIGAAALWQVRTGMRSKCRPSGVPQYAVRYNRALQKTGFLGFSPPSPNTDLSAYRLLNDLENQLAYQWATSGSPDGPPAFAHNGAHSANKVTGGFARTGIFMIPYQCIDGDATTTDATSCPSGEDGSDSVIDIDDNDPADDLLLNGVTLSEVDFLKSGGPAPTFLVWTGSRFKLNVTTGAATLANPSPCNAKFVVEVSSDPTFPAGSTFTSPETTVDTDPTTAASPECYGTWTLGAADWTTLQASVATGNGRFYYRARTRNASGGNERLSTNLGNGLYTVPPPYAVVTASGASDY